MEQDEEIVVFALQPRKKQVKAAQSLPSDFKKNVAELFNRQFSSERGEATFAIYGGLYPDEVLFCICFSELGKLRAISFYTSVDLGKSIGSKPEQVTDILKSCVDLTASWFAQVFSESKQKAEGVKKSGLEIAIDSIEDVSPDWQKTEWEKKVFYVKINRENQVLESATDRFLKEGK